MHAISEIIHIHCQHTQGFGVGLKSRGSPGTNLNLWIIDSRLQYQAKVVWRNSFYTKMEMAIQPVELGPMGKKSHSYLQINKTFTIDIYGEILE